MIFFVVDISTYVYIQGRPSRGCICTPTFSAPPRKSRKGLGHIPQNSPAHSAPPHFSLDGCPWIFVSMYGNNGQKFFFDLVGFPYYDLLNSEDTYLAKSALLWGHFHLVLFFWDPVMRTNRGITVVNMVGTCYRMNTCNTNDVCLSLLGMTV